MNDILPILLPILAALVVLGALIPVLMKTRKNITNYPEKRDATSEFSFCHATGSTGLLERLKLAQALLNEQLRAALELAMRAHPLTSRFDMRHPGAGFLKDDACEKRRKWRFRQ